jgi:hypothetical protein
VRERSVQNLQHFFNTNCTVSIPEKLQLGSAEIPFVCWQEEQHGIKIGTPKQFSVN